MNDPASPTPEEIWAVSVHEAGHAVMAHALGAEVGEVLIDVSGAPPSGDTRVKPGDKTPWMEALIARAGFAAQIAFSVDHVLQTGAIGDERRIMSALDELYPEDEELQERARGVLVAQADDFFASGNVRAAAHAIAAAVREQGTLAGRDVHLLISAHLAKDHADYCNFRPMEPGETVL